MSITIKEIAKELGVNPSTVSKALNDRTGVNKTLRAIIKKTAERLGYAPYMVARQTGMYATKLKTIAVLYPRLGPHIIEKLQRGTDKIFNQKGYFELRYSIDIASALINENIENELIFKRLLQDDRISGVIFAFTKISDVLLAQFHKNKIPTVLLNNYTDYSKCITINNFKAMYQVIEKLIKLNYKKISLVMPSETQEQVWKDRFDGYKKCLKDHKIPYDPNMIIHEWTFKLDEAAYATKKIKQQYKDVDAFVYGSDIQAFGGLKALKDMEIKVPEEVAVIGFDDMNLDQIVSPSLSSVSQPIEEMGELGAKMITDAIKNKDFSHEAVELQCSIHLRGSCLKDYKEPFWG